MNCGALSNTGLEGIPLLLAALVALCLVLCGVVLVFARQRRGGMPAIAALALLVVAGLGLGTVNAAPASAACETTEAATETARQANYLTITQTSELTGLAPNAPPNLIRGTVTNNSGEETYIAAIQVSIGSVTLAAGAVGTCDASDFDLVNPLMPVVVMLGAHETLTFEGATIAFRDELWNQDGCQGAALELLYVTT